jgi:hypothetical protein
MVADKININKSSLATRTKYEKLTIDNGLDGVLKNFLLLGFHAKDLIKGKRVLSLSALKTKAAKVIRRGIKYDMTGASHEEYLTLS